MSYKLRFIQVFKHDKTMEFSAIEKQFIAFEANNNQAPKGKRYIPIAGRESSNTLIWECDFPTLEDAQKAQAFFLADSQHDALFQEQSKFIVGTYSELYRPFD